MTDTLVPASTLQTLYSDHHGWLKRWLRGKTGCSEQASDLAQDTFVQVLRNHARLDSVREPRAYLWTIARNLLYTHVRRRSLEQTYLDTLANLPENLAPSPEHEVLIREALLEIDAMLGSLPPAVSRAFLLVQLDGLRYAQVARLLGVNVRTVERYIARAYAQCILMAP